MFRVGKIKRDSFLELVRSSSGMEESDQFREQIKTGKLNVTELYRNNNQKPETGETEMIRVGKLNTKVSNNITRTLALASLMSCSSCMNLCPEWEYLKFRYQKSESLSLLEALKSLIKCHYAVLKSI